MATKKTATRKMPTDPYFEQALLAKAAIREIEALSLRMGLAAEARKTALRPLMGHASTPKKLVHQVAAAVEQHEMLRALAFDPDLAREQLAFAQTFEPVAVQAEALAQRVRDAILIAKANAGGSALAVYASMKGMVRSKNGAVLRESFDKMQLIMKERRKPGEKRKRKADRAVAKAAAAKDAARTAEKS